MHIPIIIHNNEYIIHILYNMTSDYLLIEISNVVDIGQWCTDRKIEFWTQQELKHKDNPGILIHTSSENMPSIILH